jgi:hypothetical protein
LKSNERRVLLAIAALLVAGTVLRLFLSFRYIGIVYDAESYRLVFEALRHDPLHTYSAVNVNSRPPVNIPSWPYPPAYLPWVLIAHYLSVAVGGNFMGWIKLPLVAADGAIALVVQDHLRRLGAGATQRVLSVAFIALGPAFFGVSGFQGHMDALATLPVVAAVCVWARSNHHRSVLAGVLVGVGAAIKTVPLFMLLALLPTARSWRERLLLVIPAVAIPLLMILPFLVADPNGVMTLSHYQSLPGFGGLSLLIQPDLANGFLATGQVDYSSASRLLVRYGGFLTIFALAVVAPLLFWRRTRATEAAALVWLTIYVFAPGFFFPYLVWSLPFLLLLGKTREVLVLMLVVAVPQFILYHHARPGTEVRIFQVMMIGLYLLLSVEWVRELIRALRTSPVSRRWRLAPLAD